MPEFCSTSIDGHVLTVTIERPEVMNSLHPLANAEMGAVFDEFAANPALWVAIVTGRGDRAFSAGNDLKYQAQGGIPAAQKVTADRKAEQDKAMASMKA